MNLNRSSGGYKTKSKLSIKMFLLIFLIVPLLNFTTKLSIKMLLSSAVESALLFPRHCVYQDQTDSHCRVIEFF